MTILFNSKVPKNRMSRTFVITQAVCSSKKELVSRNSIHYNVSVTVRGNRKWTDVTRLEKTEKEKSGE